MTVNELIEKLQAIVKVHPEAGECHVWYYAQHVIHGIGYDKKHRKLTLWEEP